MATRGVNQATVLGYVGKDPELGKTNKDRSVVNLPIATKEVWKDKDDNKQSRTDWHHATFYGKSAEIIDQYVKKGDQLFIQGRMHTRSWTDKDNIKRYTMEITVTDFQLIWSSPAGEKPEDAESPEDTQPQPDPQEQEATHNIPES